MVHSLKIKKEYFNEVASERKTFEIRKNDRDFHTGDILALNEIDKSGKYTGNSLLCKVVYILDSFEGLAPGYVAMSVKVFMEDRGETDDFI